MSALVRQWAAPLGSAAWLTAMAAMHPDWPEAMLLLGALVVVPLGLGLVGGGDPYLDRARGWQPFGALALIGSVAMPVGRPAALLALPWLAITVLVAMGGVRRLRRSPGGPAEWSIDAGLIYLAVGGGWAVLSRLGTRPLDFPSLIVLLTAVHFHYAGFALPVLAGLAARNGGGRVGRLACLGVVAGVPLVAAGITESQLRTGLLPPRLLELAAAWLTAGSTVAVGLVQIHLGASRAGWPIAARILLGVSGLSVLGPMALSGLYALGLYAELSWIGIDRMIPWHGVVNAVGFALSGLVAWNLVERRRRDGAA